MYQLNIGDRMIPYDERRSVRYRRITLSILEDHLRISAPYNISAKQLQELLLAKQEWILKHWLAKQDALKSPARYIDGEHFLYRGNIVGLKITRHPRQIIQVDLKGKVLEVYLPQDLPKKNCVPNIRTALLSWYKAQARKVLQNKLNEQAKRMQVTFHTFRLKEQRTIWGSCSSKGNLNFNWQIIMAPDAVIKYIVIHELAHLTHLNHSEHFWQRVAEFMPEYAHWKKWLKEHGQELKL